MEYINENSLVIVEVNKTSADDEVEQNGDVGFEQKKRYVVMNVTGAQTSKVYDGDIIVKESDGDSELGFLCIADGKDITLSELTDFKAIAVHLDWLQSTSENEFHISPTSSFIIENSYLFVHADKYETYHSIYRDGAPIWGGFSHVEPSKKYQETVTEIIAVKDIKMPTSEHEMKLSKIVSSSDGFERFLSKYHLLELLYDYICVAKLRSVTEVKDFRDIMNSYARDDIKNLKSLVTNYVSEISKLLDIICEIKNHESLAFNIFQNHSKDSNPLKEDSNWDKFIAAIDANKLTHYDMTEKQYQFIKNIKEESKFKEAILNICSYWIYRIRCSIAHNKIGEYIFSNEDEDFVILFGERILDEIIKQLFTNTDLVELMEKSQLIDEM